MSERREAFRQVALKLLEIRTYDDYDAIVQMDWIDAWLKEAALFTEKMLAAEFCFSRNKNELD